MSILFENTYSGLDGITYLDSLLKDFQNEEILLVTGNKSFFNQSFTNELSSLFKKYSIHHYVYEHSNPDEKHLLEFAHQYANLKYRCFIAIGGGSVIDFCKLIIHKCSNYDEINFIAIPTTSGTGSEQTQFATFYKNGIKQSADAKHLKPKHIILDPVFNIKLPRQVSIHTGLDSLSQCIESYWNYAATEKSKKFAREGIIRIKDSFTHYINHRDETNSRLMLEAATYSGAAIQLTKTTAAHALSYGLTWDYQIPHGLAVALCLPSLADYNQELSKENCQDPEQFDRLNKNLKELSELLCDDDVFRISDFLKSIFQKLNVNYGLRSYNIPFEKLNELADSASISNRASNNPRKLSKNDLYQLLVNAYE